MKNKKVLFLTQAAMIAALYVVLTFIANAFGLASGVIQIRLSEALTVLPFFTPAAVPGLYVGCLLANLLTGGCLLDILIGSLATLIGALGARALRKWKWLVPLPNIVANTIIVPFVLTVGYGFEDAWWYLMLTVGIGEIISGGILGMFLLFVFKKHVTRLPDFQ
ncbi:MAG: QueT transporter family protein [Lachnospiraceae bacterium]|nr:QueT transporter family protein [Lachnospiraceae bacterium]MBQ7780400.1 QueT transporter family protein [Lachnospiraceae bacterium]